PSPGSGRLPLPFRYRRPIRPPVVLPCPKPYRHSLEGSCQLPYSCLDIGADEGEARLGPYTPIGCQTVLNSMYAVTASGLRASPTPARTTRFTFPDPASSTALTSSEE